MTRIIAGFAGSQTLQVPKSGTRPTSDRVREALFSALGTMGLPQGARVLDLYAGSGAVGLEAASRGAAEVVLVERASAAAAICAKNADRIRAAAPAGRAPQISVAAQAVRTWLSTQGARAFDVVFVDPPYELSDEDVAADLEALQPLLAEDAVVVVERSSRSPEPAWPAGLEPFRRKDYGETVLWWAEVPPAD